MWYRIDFSRLVVQLLPPLLRSRFLLSLLGVLTLPLRKIYADFHDEKDGADIRLNTNGHVVSLEKVLNDAFFLTDRQIYIESQEGSAEPMLFFISELQEAPVLFTQGEDVGYYLAMEGESTALINIPLKVPTFLCTSMVSASSDAFGWLHLRTIRNLLNRYKPAGRTFSIELYDYE